MTEIDDKTSAAIKILTQASDELNRLPKRRDFDDKTVCFIKQKLGPWPRALEKAGLKPITKISAKEKSKQKRERLKNKTKFNGEG